MIQRIPQSASAKQAEVHAQRLFDSLNELTIAKIRGGDPDGALLIAGAVDDVLNIFHRLNELRKSDQAQS